jgi:hypothetical protein
LLQLLWASSLSWQHAEQAQAPRVLQWLSLQHQFQRQEISRHAPWSSANQKAWKLIVSFLVGSRQGQQETSYMTFSPDGKLTATFPSATPGALDALPPAIDGKWCATGATMFAYEFRDPIMAGGHMVAYVQTALSATMTSATTYRADGVGVAYSTKTAMPLPGQYNVTRTVAVAIQDT